jgi:hypothetical protein
LMLPAFFGLIYFSDRILHFCLGQPWSIILLPPQ